ncbi:hypothetical protein C1645_763039 [Glomus cerebriforme]|uniref:Nucleosome assembly protein n=1 Tax=Glomus cerebriforme TaxID=658196 RepID=A0A397TE69_9GLOM|nr:hypothetical protein C1645_763039 [Glomus cerebriforme]
MAEVEVENGGIESIDDSIVEEMKVLTQEFETAELEIAKQQIRAFKPIYEKRKNVLKKIPKFWSTVLTKRIFVAQYLATDDYSVIQYIDDLTVEKDENSLYNFKIILSFSENDYFKNKELVKEFIVDADERKIKSTPIEWFDGRDYTKKRKADEDEDDQSFIKWFSEENTDESSWELGRAIKDEIYPQAWMIYLNEEYEEEDDDEEGVNQEFDDESEEEELDVPSKKRVKHN